MCRDIPQFQLSFDFWLERVANIVEKNKDKSFNYLLISGVESARQCIRRKAERVFQLSFDFWMV